MEQLAEEDKAEQEQKRAQDTVKELINEATKKMAAAVELKNMQSVKVSQLMLKAGNEKLQETSQKLETIGAKQKKISENDCMIQKRKMYLQQKRQRLKLSTSDEGYDLNCVLIC